MDLLRAYIQYLRDVSRKIVNRAGFENVLPNETRKKKNYYFNLDSYEELEDLFKVYEYSISSKQNKFFEYINVVNSFLQSNDDHRLFIGLGIVHGKYEDTWLCAPLVTVVAIVNNTDDGKFEINVDEQSYQVNYDLLAKFLNIKIDEENEERTLTQEEEAKFKVIEEVENEILRLAEEFQIPDALEIFRKLKNKITNFESIKENAQFGFDNESRFKDFFGTTYFTNHTFCFVRNVPNTLSTYEALNDLLHQDTLSNQLLETLLSNSIKNKNNELPMSESVSEVDIFNSINSIPLTLSTKQKEAIRKTWKNPITYIEGPPGTGKSHTIQALILSALYLNKKVLFVSHKKPAIDVVKEKLEKILGSESLMYIGTAKKIGIQKGELSPKKKTITHLKTILDEGEELTTQKLRRKQNDINSHLLDLDRIESEIKEIRDDVEKDLRLSNEHFTLNKSFVAKRDFFSNDLGIELKDYRFKTKLYSQAKFKKFYTKLKLFEQGHTTTRLTELYKIKAIKYFMVEFEGTMDKLSGPNKDINYYNDIFELNYFYSRGLEKKKKIAKNRLDNNRRRLSSLQTEKTDLLTKLAPKQFQFQILSKVFENREAADSVKSYASSLRRVAPKAIIEHWDKVDFDLLTEIIPLWCAELRDLGTVFPMEHEIFDLVIVDEASQVNIAEIIPAFYRGKKFCIVGDDKQLHLNATGVGFSLSKSFDNLCWNKNGLQSLINVAEAKTRNLLVSDASVLKFINSDLRAQRIPQTQLDEHYRSLPQLARFNSEKFYESPWKIMTENGKNRSIQCFKAIKVTGVRDSKSKFIKAEVDELIIQLKKLVKNNGYLNHPDLKQFDFTKAKPTIGVLSILRNQITKINDSLEDSGISDSEIDDFEIMVGTPEEFQGNEKDIMFITIGLDGTANWGKGHFEDVHRFNVATSRAKFFTYFIYAGIPRNATLIKKYLNHFSVKINEEDLIDLESIPTAPESPDENWKYKPENFESEFERKVADCLCEFKDRHSEIEIFNQVRACGQKRLDFVLYNTNKKITCAVEVDGIDHFIGDSEKYSEAHLERIEILNRANWKVINLKYHNWYSEGWLCDKKNSIFETELTTLYKHLAEILELKN